jgi:phenylpropionate dioxygenase-like ring-hydroxylating dioxygenase large terminal subunit
MELVLKSLESAGEDEDERIGRAREKMETIRRRLLESLERFSIQIRKPGPRQVLAAELSRLWVVLENARPERMKGYGREFSPADKAAWERLIEGLMSDVKEMRRILVKGRVTP